MATTARDVMQEQVVCVGPNTPLINVYRLFVEEEINGAPVVDETGALLGVISSSDLLRVVQEENEQASSDASYFQEDPSLAGLGWHDGSAEFQSRLSQRTVQDAMTPAIVSVTPDTSLPVIAKTFRSDRVHRVLVVEDDKLLGIISTFDLVRLLE